MRAGRHHSSVHGACAAAANEQDATVLCAASLVGCRLSGVRRTVFLATARVNVADRFGDYRAARVLIDPGSETSLISESFAQRLRLSRSPTSVTILGVGSQTSGVARGRMRVEISSRFGTLVVETTALVLPRLTTYGENFSVDRHPWLFLDGLELADSEFYRKGTVDLLLGVEIFACLTKDGLRKNGPGKLAALKTMLG